MCRRRRHIQGNCAANCVRGALATSARFAAKFCRRGYTRGNSRVRPRLTRLFPPLERPGCGARIARRAKYGACALRPLPLLRLAASAAGGAQLCSLRQNFTANRALVANAPRTQFAAKFPCMCRRRRRMSADGDVFKQYESARGDPAGFLLCGFSFLQAVCAAAFTRPRAGGLRST